VATLAAVLALLTGCASPVLRAPSAATGAAGVTAGNEVVLAALNFLDVGYRAGGDTAADGFDCSGFTRHVYGSALGVSLPRSAEAQAGQAGWLDVRADDLAPGDLVFFNTLRRRFSHVGIYVGEGRFIHAPRTGARVRIEGMRVPYWASRFDGGRRAPLSAMAMSDALP
jgi:cell wall-associated NlpC family hydrolase